MANELAVIERQLQAVAPRFDNALSGLMPAKALIQTVLISCERTPKLLECRPQTILNGAMTFAVLGLPVDGATGQGFLLPFKDNAQAVIGYKGYNTMGARCGLTITGGAVREDDHEWDFRLGTGGFLHHKPRLGSTARTIAFWSVAEARDRPPIISVLSIDDVMAIKAKSPGAKRSDSPWNDPAIGFPAMAEKSAKRRLARSTPLIAAAPQFMMAARIEEAFDEQGKHAWATPERGVVVEGDFAVLPPGRHDQPTPTYEEMTGRGIPPPSPLMGEGHGERGAEFPAGFGEDGDGEGDAGRPVTPRSFPSPLQDKRDESEIVADHDKALGEAAKQGTKALAAAWTKLPTKYQHLLSAAKDRRHKPAAEKADEAKGNA